MTTVSLPRAQRVECQVCGRRGEATQPWVDKCAAGHPWKSACGKRWATKAQAGTHARHHECGGYVSDPETTIETAFPGLLTAMRQVSTTPTQEVLWSPTERPRGAKTVSLLIRPVVAPLLALAEVMVRVRAAL